MQIKRLKLTGFKSFVEATELRIEEGLTGIVGPNGCGKSNLLEAIRWVMGESSAKSMRGGGMEDVIFAGTASRPQREFAEVAILTERAPHELTGPVSVGEDGELEIMRRIERGAGSAYRANGRDVRAKDVALIFADAATGAHSPALVSQGKIAAVIAAKPTERRMMLEEAAGIAGLHVRRKDAEQKLRATEANLARLDDILMDMDNRANALRRQAKAAERYSRLTDQIRVAEARLIYARWRDAAKAADAARAEAKTAEALVNQAHEAQQAAAAYQNEAVKQLAIRRSEAQKARDAANEAGHKLAALRSEEASIRQRLTDLESQAARLEEDKAREGSLAHDAAEAIERLAAEAEQIAARVKETESIVPDFDARIAKADGAARDAELELAKAMARQASEQAELRVAEAALNTAQGRLDRARRDAQRLEQELSTLPESAPLEDSRNAALALQKRAREERELAEAAIAQAENDRSTAAEARSAAESGLSSAKAALAALDSETAALRKTIDSSSGRNRALDRIKAAPGYERALAAALGDDLEAAIGLEGKRCWLGAAPLEGDPALPSACTSLISHVTAPAELTRRLSQIAVAEVDQGQPLAVGQRLVTLEGQLRRWDGYVATEGGAAAAERLIRLNRLTAIEAVRPETVAEVESAAAGLSAAGEAAQSASEKLAAGRTALSRADQMLRESLRAADEASVKLDRLKGRREELQSRLSEMRADEVAAEAEFEATRGVRLSLPDGEETVRLVGTLKQSSEQARLAVSQLQAEQAMAGRALGADRDRLTAAQAEMRGWRARAGEAARRMEDMARRAADIAGQRDMLDGKPEAVARAIRELDESSHKLLETAESQQAAERAAEETLRQAEAKHAQAGEALAAAREARAGAAARAENQEQRRIEMGRISGERFECPAPVLPEKLGFVSADVRDATEESETLDKLTQDRERLGPVNLVAARELAELEAEQAKSRAESEELAQAIHRLRGSIGSLNREGRARLLAAFEAVDGHFQRLFTALFNGGQAHLKLIDNDDPLEAGLEIMAQPPGKKLSTLTLLSGGEQALTAVALIFGLFLTNPAPICVLDEVDAPLDDANVERFCDLLDQMVRDTRTRYLIVTHNAVTMSRMHRLFGVTMIEKGVSRLVSVDLGGAEELLAAE